MNTPFPPQNAADAAMQDTRKAASLPKRNPFGWWIALTVPPASAFDLRNPVDRERYRRAQLASGVIPVLLLLGLFQVKNAFVNIPTLAGLVVLLGGCIVGAILNRSSAITTAGVVLVASLIITLGTALAAVPEGLSLIWLPVFQIFSLAVIIAGLLLPRWLTFVTALVTSFVSLAIIAFEPRAPDLANFIAINGYPPIVLRIFADQWITAILVFLLARSIERAIFRADRAEDLAHAEAQIADQARFIAEQNARLEYGIQQLLETHRRVAAGDFTVRPPAQQDNELWQIAVSLNNLISRFGRMYQAEQRLIQIDESIRTITTQIEIARQGGRPFWPPPSGLPTDQILQALGVEPSAPPPFSSSNPGAHWPPPPPFPNSEPWNNSSPGWQAREPSKPMNNQPPPELPGSDRANAPFADTHNSRPRRPDNGGNRR